MGDPTKPTRPMVKRDSWGRYEVWPDPIAIAFGRMFRRARLMAGLSQQQLAYRSGVSQSVISRFERGLAPGMSTERLIVLAEILGGRLPLGYCPHDHDCVWRKIVPLTYDHPPAKPRQIGLPVIEKSKPRRGSDIGRRYARALAAGAIVPGTERETYERIAAEVDLERAQSA